MNTNGHEWEKRNSTGFIRVYSCPFVVETAGIRVRRGSRPLLAFKGAAVTMCGMSLFLSIAVYALMAAVIAAGIVLVMAGKPMVLIVGFLVYLILMVKIGCLSH
jgi:hypothetical protein